MQKKQGISLIVLVITIIVMIILAAAIILSLNNAGIIGNANKAVSMTNDAEIQTAADLAYAEYLIDKSVVGPGSTLETWLNEKVDYEGYKIHVVQDKPVVVKENSLADMFYRGDIEVGDYVSYKAAEEERIVETKDYKFVSKTNPAQDREIQVKVTPEQKWRVLGVDTQTKELLLTSEELVKAIDKSTNTEGMFNISGFYGWVHGGALMESICSEFGRGTYATKGRSMTGDDVATLFEYDKTQHEETYYSGKYGQKIAFDGDKVDLVYHPILDLNNNYVFNENRVPETELSSITITNNRYTIRAEDVEEKYPEGYNLIFNFNVGDGYYLNSKYTVWEHYKSESIEYDAIYYGFLVIGIKADDDRFLGSTYLATASRVLEVDYTNQKYLRPVVHIDANAGVTYDETSSTWILK